MAGPQQERQPLDEPSAGIGVSDGDEATWDHVFGTGPGRGHRAHPVAGPRSTASLSAQGQDEAGAGAGAHPLVHSRAAGRQAAAGKVGVKVRVDDATKARIDFWADQLGMSANDFLLEAIDHWIRWQNMDYPLQTMEQARLVQIQDAMHQMSSNVTNFERIFLSSMGSLMDMSRGTNYLGAQEDGELDA